MFNLASENWYHRQQQRLNDNRLFRVWCQGWSNYGIILLIPLYLPLIINRKFKLLVLIVICLIFCRLIIVPILEFLFPFKRPYQAYGLKTEFSKLLSWQTSRFNSFPSSHTASLTALSFGLYLYNPLLGLAGLVLTLLVGIGRVILGYHYPADIIGGFLVGISGSLLIKSFFNTLLSLYK